MIDIDGQQFGVVSMKKTHVLLTLPVPPSANRYWRSAQGRVYVSQEAQDYKRLVRLLASEVEPFEGDVAVSINIYRARKSGDTDNFLKVTFDALKGIVYADDSAVVEIHAFRKDDKANPRVEVSVHKR